MSEKFKPKGTEFYDAASGRNMIFITEATDEDKKKLEDQS